MADAVLGVSCLAHDAAVAVISDEQVLFAAQSERYSRKKNDPLLNNAILDDALGYAGECKKVVYYENTLLRRTRQLRSGQYSRLADISPKRYLEQFTQLRGKKFTSVKHHASHAAGAYFTSPFKDAAIVVVDAIGEWETLTIWHGQQTCLKKLFAVRYPHSLGLFYSAVTHRVGLKPNEEEYILMGMAAYGEPRYRTLIEAELIEYRGGPSFRLRRSMHRGLGEWRPELGSDEATRCDLACSAQVVLQDLLIGIFRWVASTIPSKNLVYSGGVALNCVFNGLLAELGLFDEIWIPPNPGDAGSALGAILAENPGFVDWAGPYLGHEIVGHVDPMDVAKALAAGQIVGLANGRAEYGPRALGNRSLLADPRKPDIKDEVNKIKRRQAFRPFAPAVLAERANEYFDMPVSESPYMQFVARCKRPDEVPGICHVDGTSRVQTVNSRQNKLLRSILESFYEITGCPLLLNTSLNIKGEPIVNSREDAQDFAMRYGVTVF